MEACSQRCPLQPASFPLVHRLARPYASTWAPLSYLECCGCVQESYRGLLEARVQQPSTTAQQLEKMIQTAQVWSAVQGMMQGTVQGMVQVTGQGTMQGM